MTSDKDVLIKLNRKFSSHHGRCHVLPCSVEKSGTTTSVRKYFQIQDADPSNTESFTAAQPVGNIFTETNTDKSGESLTQSAKRDVTLIEETQSNFTPTMSITTDNTTLTSAISDVSTSNSLICSNAQTDTMESTISTAMPDVQPDRQSDKVKETYFRGRKLRGMELSLPHEFIGEYIYLIGASCLNNF